jgi:ATP-dependent Clp protease ATP-binding subunit ClpX
MTRHTRYAHCSFCRKSDTEVGPLVEGPGDVHICGECVELTQQIIKKERRRRKLALSRLDHIPNCQEIQADLDLYISGQTAAKQALAAAAYRHFAPLCEDAGAQKTGQPDHANILLIGPSAGSRFFLTRALANILRVPCARGDAEALWDPEAISRGIEHPLFKLLNASEFDIQAAQKGILYIDKVDQPAVQKALLAIMAGEKTGLPSRFEIDTSNILFVCGGVFSGLEKSIARTGPAREQSISKRDLLNCGMSPELLERFGNFVHVAPLEEDALMNILGWVNFAGLSGETV